MGKPVWNFLFYSFSTFEIFELVLFDTITKTV